MSDVDISCLLHSEITPGARSNWVEVTGFHSSHAGAQITAAELVTEFKEEPSVGSALHFHGIGVVLLVEKVVAFVVHIYYYVCFGCHSGISNVHSECDKCGDEYVVATLCLKILLGDTFLGCIWIDG